MNQPTLGQTERFIVLVLLLIVLTSACTSRNRETITSVSNQSPPIVSAKGFWLQALDVAQEWRPDAYIRGVRVTVPTSNGEVPEQKDPGVKFSFQSPSEDYVTFVVTCNIERCSSFEVTQNPDYPLTQCAPIAFDDFALDSTDVFDLSLQHGGGDYISRPTASIFLRLSRSFPACTESVEWRVAFIDVVSRTGLDVIVDAVTGEIVEIRD